MVLLRVVIEKCEMPSTDTSMKMTMLYSWSNTQMSICSLQLQINSSGPEEVGQLSREFLDQSNRAIFYASWLRFLSTKFTQDGKNL